MNKHALHKMDVVTLNKDLIVHLDIKAYIDIWLLK